MTELERRLGDCGPALCAQFEKLGRDATARQAFDAWLAWVAESGGITAVQYQPSPLYEHWAFQIRQASR